MPHPTTTPDYVISAIPGADKLADAFKAARRDHANKGRALRTTGEKANALTSGHLADPARKPAAGVAKTNWDKAIDAYRVATDESKSAESKLGDAVRAFDRHVTQGMRADAFKAQYAAIGDAANADAHEHLAALKASLKAREDVNRWIGRRLKINLFDGIEHTLQNLTDYVNAQPSDTSYFYDTAVERITEGIYIPGARVKLLRTIQEIDAMAIDDKAKFAKLKTATGL